MPNRDIFSFREQRYSSYRHRLRIYIFGVEVSPWLKGSISITYGNRDSFNVASFELSNPRKIWQITRQNLHGEFRSTSAGEFSEYPKQSVFRVKNDYNLEFSLQTVRSVFADTVPPIPVSINNAGAINFTPPAGNKERKYRLGVNDCIFNKHDPVRIFMQNPMSAADEWVEIFCGFLQDHPITTDYKTGASTLKIGCYCIRQMMTKMRVQMNPLTDPNSGNLFINAGFFADFSSPSIRTQPFANSSLENAIRSLILGTTIGDTLSTTAQTSDTTTNKARNANGVGAFKLGNIICYDPATPKNTLERWHLMTTFGVNKVAFPSESPDQDPLWLTSLEVTNLGKATLWHPQPHLRGPDSRYLHMLLPAGGTGPSSLVESTIMNGPQAAEFTSRWEMIRDFASKLDFQVLTSPSGDLLVEFPAYGFTPSAYSRQGPNQTENPEQEPEGLPAVFTFNQHQKEDTLNDEGEDFPTILMVSGGQATSETNVDGNSPNYPQRSYIYSPVLASRYGVIVESVDFPFAGQNAGDIGTPLNIRLSKLGMIEYIKRLSDASSWDGSLAYRPFLFPNRPVYLKRSSRIGTMTSVSYQWNVDQRAATLSVSANSLMYERYDPQTSTSTFRLLTGAQNVPISYASIWGGGDSGGPPATEGGAVGDKPGVNAADPNSGVFSPSTNAVDGPASTNPANPDTPLAPGQIRERVTNPPAIRDLGSLYPPFANMIQQLITECQRNGISVSVREAFRSSTRQQEIYDKYKGTGTNAEAFKSWHQYGLAVDLAPVVEPQGELSTDRAVLKRVYEISVELGLGLVWGGNFRSFYDGWHFEKPDNWIDLRTAFSYQQKYGDPQYLQEVWRHIDVKIMGDVTYNKAIPPGRVATTAGGSPNVQACEPNTLANPAFSEFEGG